MGLLKCSCGKSYTDIQDLLNCFYSGHEQCNDIQTQGVELLKATGASRFSCSIFNDGFSSFRLEFGSSSDFLEDESFQDLIDKTEERPSPEPVLGLGSGHPATRPALVQAGPASKE